MAKNNKIVLIIDDQKVVRFTLGLSLKNIGEFKVLEAVNGQTAKDLIKRHHIDIIFCDLNMPVEDGFSVLRFLANIEYKGAVILISGEDQELLDSTSNLGKLYNLNILSCLKKPITYIELKGLLNLYEDSYFLPRSKKLNSSISHKELIAYIDSGNVVAFFQPQINLKTKKVIGFEVLARIIDDSGNIIMPDSFIELAERYPETIIALTKKVILTAFEDMSSHLKSFENFSISLNISGKVLEYDNFTRWLHELALHYSIPKGQIVCELTETALNEDQTLIDSQLLRLKMMKFRLSIDDFGTGYSSIAQLHSIPFSELKIDKRFVADCLTNLKSAVVIEQSIKMAKAMNIDVVAEGVETDPIAEYLFKLGCDIGQGYLYAKPQKIEELLPKLLSKNFL